MDSAFITNLILASVRMATPLIFLSLAELYSQRAGLVHIGLEGLAAIGSLAGFLVIPCWACWPAQRWASW